MKSRLSKERYVGTFDQFPCPPQWCSTLLFNIQVIFFSLDEYLTLPWALERSLDLQSYAQLPLKIRIIHSSEEGSQRRKTNKKHPLNCAFVCFFFVCFCCCCSVNNLQNQIFLPTGYTHFVMVPRTSLYTFPYCQGLFLAKDNIKC